MPNISDEAVAKVASHTDAQLAQGLRDLVEQVQDWDETSLAWECDCGLGKPEQLDSHDPGCPYLLYFMLTSLASEAARRLQAGALAWVRQHGQHPPTCSAPRGGHCDCGLDALRQCDAVQVQP